jgi:hypothetical protein
MSWMTREDREAIAYILGGAGFVHELFIAQGDRPFLLTASLALMGFPLVLKGEQKLRDSGKLPELPNEEEE